MSVVTVDLPRCKYEVEIEPGILASAGSQISQMLGASRLAIIADEGVFSLHGDPLVTSLKEAGSHVYAFTQVEGEREKTLETVRSYYDKFLSAGFDRSSGVISFGGGVVGDTAGFVAATYFRGIPFVQCPTSLLSMVDASVGGKVGVNLPQGKNLVGAFHQPRKVIIDPNVLVTLPDRELRCGLAECIKHAVIRDSELFSWTSSKASSFMKRDITALAELIKRNVEVKARVVEEDETEQGVRAHLNFGHTFGHAIEACLGFERIKHGEAVALGMLAASRLAVTQKLCGEEVLNELKKILLQVGLPVQAELPSNAELIEAMHKDKKSREGVLRLVLPTKIGEVVIVEGARELDLIEAWDSIRAKKN
jgi:3-dehydroquinate synthase